MFERPTVFIVGAGASKEVNFPMGSELAQIIAQKLDIKFRDGLSRSSGDRKIYESVKRYVEERGSRNSNAFFHAGRHISSGMSQAISIDNYLHTHADNEEVVWMGKAGIAASILEAERGSSLALSRERHELDLAELGKSWYHPFFQMLTEGVQRGDLASLFESVAFITFNYDRCIEHFLVHALVNYYQIGLKEAEALVNTLQIEHPYGQVGRLPWQQPNGSTPFGKDFQPHELPLIASQIRTFTERVEDGEMIERTKRLLSRAEVVVYLGFSYGDMNMELLSLDQAGERIVFGTSLHISEPNKSIIKQDIVNAMGPHPEIVRSVDLADMTCSEMLRAYWRPILRGL